MKKNIANILSIITFLMVVTSTYLLVFSEGLIDSGLSKAEKNIFNTWAKTIWHGLNETDLFKQKLVLFIYFTIIFIVVFLIHRVEEYTIFSFVFFTVILICAVCFGFSALFLLGIFFFGIPFIVLELFALLVGYSTAFSIVQVIIIIIVSFLWTFSLGYPLDALIGIGSATHSPVSPNDSQPRSTYDFIRDAREKQTLEELRDINRKLGR